MQRFLLPVSMWVCTGVACTYLDGELPSVPGGSTTLRLEKESDGDLRYCDAQGDCVHDLPNPYDCTSLEVRIDEATGAVCETCYDANGRVIKDHCDNTSVTCVLLTNSDPDCLACAYIDRTVLYVTCAEEMPSCEYFAGDPSGAWAQTSPTSYECKRCYDASGRLIIESCAHDCTREVCMAVDCGEGFASVIYPGECCPRCEPIAHCGAVVCSAETAAVPTCFDGYRLERDANDCCAYRCVPESCSAVACPATDQRCPSGYTWDSSGSYPDCCGRCVPSDSARYCTEADTSQCDPDNEMCSASYECLPPPDCDPEIETCPLTCYGVCRPADYTCATYAYPFIDCAGYWADGGRDEYGCPLPPVCTCYDGTVSGDGTCPDRCENTSCFSEGCTSTSCGDGYHCESGYPYCCGTCVANDQCLYNGTNKSTGETCAPVTCPSGYREQLDSNCCPTCVPDDTTYCVDGQVCATGTICSTACGECMTEPYCMPGSTCTGACYGTCVTACANGATP